MKFSTATAVLISLHMASVLAFAPLAQKSAKSPSVQATKTVSNEIESSQRKAAAAERPLYDPLGLYPKSSKDQGRIRSYFAEEDTAVESTQQLNQFKKIRDPMGLYPKNSPEFQEALQEEQATVIANNEKPLYDPMYLYSANTVERREGLIQAMEPSLDEIASDTFARLKETRDPLGLYPADSQEYAKSMELEIEERASADCNRQLYDPLGLYATDAPEYQEGKIRSLEPEIKVVKPVLDPLNIYPSESKEEVDRDVVMSKALPFIAKPASLAVESEGSAALVGDAGFDPLGFAKSEEGLLWQREAELKHSRIAMLAAAGWPISELFHGKLSALAHLKPLLVEGDRVPSIVNGGLQHVNPFYWMGILAVAGIFEAVDIMTDKSSDSAEKQRFDPLGLFPADSLGQERMQLAEIKNGRLAMMAITAFAAIEAVTHQAVINVTPFLFHPPSF